MTGCEVIKCPFFVDNKCTDKSDTVSMHDGEPMCSQNDDAIEREDYDYDVD